MSSYILLSEKPWHDDLFERLRMEVEGNWYRIATNDEFTIQRLRELQPNKIFIPHWSYIIPRSIFENFECIVFHMTDLPYGRGGSPLQNLIIRGHEETMISAIKVIEGIDAGPIYLKRKLQLNGSAQEIFLRTSMIVKEMILEIISNQPIPVAQVGEPIFFKRRKPADSNIQSIDDMKKLYDHIRMLDADGYPHAFLEDSNFIFEFTNANHINNDTITANVRITKK